MTLSKVYSKITYYLLVFLKVMKQLPQKTEQLEYCHMIPDQQELYDRLIRNFTNKLTDEGNEVNIAGGAAMLMQLRKAANHPLLHRTHYTDEKIQEMSKVLAEVTYEL